jgi:hypothetical protein
MMASTRFLATLLAMLALTLPAPLSAQETASETVHAEVAACTSRALGGTLGADEFLDWVTPCRLQADEACALAPRTKGQRIPCSDYSRAAWKEAADQIRAHLIARWQSCKVSDAVKSEMIKAVEDTDAAILALFAANCGYDSAQWRAFDQPNIADARLARCMAEAEAVRATIHFQNLLRDAGCDAAQASP